MAVYVFGAGATRGAEFSGAGGRPCLPPLDADFYTQLQRVGAGKHQDLIDNVIEDTVRLFGSNFSVTMETVFSTLENTMRMVRVTGESRDFKYSELREMRDRLVQSIAVVLEESMTDSGSSRSELECCWHRDLVLGMRSGDSVITFNYDCLLDGTLREHGNHCWNARYGYDLPLGKGRTQLSGSDYWTPRTGTSVGRENTVLVYKLHGSLHFQYSPDSERMYLKQRPYTTQYGRLNFTIIPPEGAKDYDREPFRRLWKSAGAALHRTDTVVVVGYSFPPTDLHSSALFRVSVTNDALRNLVIVNPDSDARRRAREILERGMTDRTRVVEFDYLHEFASVRREHWEHR